MGTVNVIKGLSARKETLRFNGKIRDNLDLNWEYVKIFKSSEELTPDYEVQEDDVILMQEYPSGTGTGSMGWDITLGILTGGIYSAVVAYNMAEQAQRELERALDRLKNQTNAGNSNSIPWLSGGKNEKIDGKQAPIIIGRHLFTPYYLSEPYLRPEGKDGEDLYWHATFLCGQTGLAFEKVRNGVIDLVTIGDNSETKGSYRFADIGEPGTGSNIIHGTWGSNTRISDFVEELVAASGGLVLAMGSWHIPAPHGGKYGNWDLYSITVSRTLNSPPNNILYKAVFNTSDGDKTRQGVSAAWAGTAETINYQAVINDAVSSNKNKLHIIQEGYFSDAKNFPFLDHDSDLGIFDQKWVDSLDSSTEITRKAKEDARTVNAYGDPDSNGRWIEDLGPEYIVRESARFPMKLEIEVFVDGLIGQKAEETSVNIRLQWSKNQDGPWDSAPMIPIDKWDYSPIGSVEDFGPSYKLKRNTNKQMRFIASLDLTKEQDIFSKEGNPVYIKATRITRMHVAGYKDRVCITAIRTQQYNPKESSSSKLIPAKNIHLMLAGKFCRMGVKIKVNGNTESVLDRFYIVASMTARTWNGSSWSQGKTKTSNPAALALEALTGLNHKPSEYFADFENQKNPNNEIDLVSFGELYAYCKGREIAVDGSEVKHAFNIEANGVITAAAKKLDVLKSILSVCDGGLYVNEFGMLVAYYDDRQEEPLALINKHRILAGGISETRNMGRRADGYRVEFIDEGADWSPDARMVLKPKVEAKPGNTFTSVKFEFTTNYYQAMWLARRMMAKEIHRPGELKVKIGKEGRHYRPGSMVKAQHEGFKNGIGGGGITDLVRDGNYITGFKLMEKFDISDSRDYFIDYYVVTPDRNRVPKTRQIQSVGAYTDTLMLTSPIREDDTENIPVYGNILSVIDNERHNTVTIRESNRYLVKELSETYEGYELTLVAYSDEIYNTTSIDKISPYISNIITANPRTFEEQKRQELELKVADLDKITQPQNLYEIARNAVEGEIPPRFLGAVTIPPESMTSNYIASKGVYANEGDYFIYAGSDGENGFTANRIYQWGTGTWLILPLPSDTPEGRDNAIKYWEALPHLTAGSPEVVATIGFFNEIIVNLAFIKKVFSEIIEMMPPGIIMSKDFKGINGGVPGYWLKAFDQATGGGLIETNNLVARNMKAVDADIEGGLNAGGKFTDGGYITNANRLGGLLVRKDGGDMPLAYNLKVFGILGINNPNKAGGDNVRPTLSMSNGIKNLASGYTPSWVGNIIQGRMARAALSDRIISATGTTGDILVHGSLIVETGGPSGAVYTTYIITHVYIGAYCIAYGMRIPNTTYYTQPTAGEGIALTGNETVIANLVIQ
jgi:hypothetical protein